MNKDWQIIKRVGEGNQAAFRELYNLFSSKVYNVAISYVQNEADAEEITQDVFTKIFQNAGKFRGDSALGTWIYRITVNAALNHSKKKKRFNLFSLNNLKKIPVDFEHPGILLENKEKAKTLFKVIDTLPEKQKMAFILSFVEEIPRQEVADIMEISLKAVESLLQRAKGNLRKKLEKEYPHRKKKR